MAKQLQFNEEARRSLVAGVEKISRAVMTTLGPKGRNVLLDKKFGAPTVTKDGVSVAREIELEDPFENMGAQLLKEVATKTNDVAGDGTTTATVLAWSITKEGMKSVAAGVNPMGIRRGIDKAVADAIVEIKKQAKVVNSKEEISQVASISANNDTTIGDEIANAMEKVGQDGVITIEESKTIETTTDFVEGMQFYRGYLSACCARGSVHPHCRQEDFRYEGSASCSGEGGTGRQAPAYYCRGCRWRGSGNPGCQQRPWYPERGCRQGSWFW